jgi:hypothetical protein
MVSATLVHAVRYDKPMQAISTAERCAECRAAQKAKRLPGTAEVVGRHVSTNEGVSTTEYDFLQYSACGSMWLMYRDTGVGRGGPWHVLLTEEWF